MPDNGVQDLAQAAAEERARKLVHHPSHPSLPGGRSSREKDLGNAVVGEGRSRTICRLLAGSRSAGHHWHSPIPRPSSHSDPREPASQSLIEYTAGSPPLRWEARNPARRPIYGGVRCLNPMNAALVDGWLVAGRGSQADLPSVRLPHGLPQPREPVLPEWAWPARGSARRTYFPRSRRGPTGQERASSRTSSR